MANGTCSVEGCETPRETRGFCIKHYRRWLRHGDPSIALKRGPKPLPPELRKRKTPVGPRPRRVCSVNGCDRPVSGHGFCSLHYQRWRRNGDPLTTYPSTFQLGHAPLGNAGVKGDRNATWVDDASYSTVHRRLKHMRGLAAAHPCSCGCGRQAREWAYDHADPDEKRQMWRGYMVEFSTDVNHYSPMATSCHRKLDLGRRKQP